MFRRECERSDLTRNAAQQHSGILGSCHYSLHTFIYREGKEEEDEKRKRRNRTYRKMMEGTNWEDVSLVYKDEGEL